MVMALVWMPVAMLLGLSPFSMGTLAPVVVILSAAFYASLYFTYADSFEPDPTPEETPS